MQQRESGTCHLSEGVISLGTEPGCLWPAESGTAKDTSAVTSIICSYYSMECVIAITLLLF